MEPSKCMWIKSIKMVHKIRNLGYAGISFVSYFR